MLYFGLLRSLSPRVECYGHSTALILVLRLHQTHTAPIKTFSTQQCNHATVCTAWIHDDTVATRPSGLPPHHAADRTSASHNHLEHHQNVTIDVQHGVRAPGFIDTCTRDAICAPGWRKNPLHSIISVSPFIRAVHAPFKASIELNHSCS